MKKKKTAVKLRNVRLRSGPLNKNFQKKLIHEESIHQQKRILLNKQSLILSQLHASTSWIDFKHFENLILKARGLSLKRGPSVKKRRRPVYQKRPCLPKEGQCTKRGPVCQREASVPKEALSAKGRPVYQKRPCLPKGGQCTKRGPVC